jgi:hypothetical protein
MKKILLFIGILIFISNFTYGFSPPPDTFQVYGILKVKTDDGLTSKTLIDTIISLTGGNVFIPKNRVDSIYINKYLILQATSQSDVPTTPGAQGLLMLENGTRQLRYYGKDYAGNTGWHTLPDSAMVRTFTGDSSFKKITVDTVTTDGSDSTVYISRNLSVGYKTSNLYDYGYVSLGAMSRYGKIYGLSYFQNEPYGAGFGHNIHIDPQTYGWIRDDSTYSNGSNLIKIATGNTRRNQGFGFYYNKSYKTAIDLRQIMFIATGDSVNVRGVAITSDTVDAGYPRKALDIKVGSSILGDTAFVETAGVLHIVPWDDSAATRDDWLLPGNWGIDSTLIPVKDSINVVVQLNNYPDNGMSAINRYKIWTNRTGAQYINLVANYPIPNDFESWDADSAICIYAESQTNVHYLSEVVITQNYFASTFYTKKVDSLANNGTGNSFDTYFTSTDLDDNSTTWVKGTLLNIRFLCCVKGNLFSDPLVIGPVRLRYKVRHGLH